MPTLPESLALLRGAWDRTGRVGEHWVRGPVGAPVAQPISFDQYIRWVREVEAPSPSVSDTIRRLRRVRVSRHVRGTEFSRGARLDDLLAGDSQEEPLTWSSDVTGVSQSTLDGLATCRYAGTAPRGSRIDTARLFAAIDAVVSGPSELGHVATRLTGTPVAALASWVGDLAAWFVEWERHRAAAEREQPWTNAQAAEQLATAQRRILPLEALLGDIDGHVLAAAHVATTSFSVLDPDGIDGPQPRRLVQDAVPPSHLLTMYFVTPPPPTPAISTPSAAHRFRLLVDFASPLIGNGAGGLATDAEQRVAAHVRRTVAFFTYHGTRCGWFSIDPPISITDAVGRVDAQTPVIQTIAQRFVAFVRGGLQTGTPPDDWPAADA